ncbi:DDB1- and CUL4-associated factor 4-like isoform X1 [Tachypleus tridentatus]|uniref:DDB1- and CUL4-associated factor 4-like isoform X1 n=1 Tax=Tachypleus tridentatus TaxID=6853 RepID=UPI003FCFA80A
MNRSRRCHRYKVRDSTTFEANGFRNRGNRSVRENVSCYSYSEPDNVKNRLFSKTRPNHPDNTVADTRVRPNVESTSKIRYRCRRGAGCNKSNVTDKTSVFSDIPGFFYDHQKKKYFRILPGHNNHNPLTVANIYKQESVKNCKYFHTKKAEEANPPLLNNFATRQLGLIQGKRVISNFIGNKMLKMKNITRVKIDNSALDYPLTDCRYLVGFPDKSTILGSWSLEKQPGILIQSINLEDALEGLFEESSENGNLFEGKNCEIVNIHPHYRVADMCWTDISTDLSFVLIVCTGCDVITPALSCVQLRPVRQLCGSSSSVLQDMDQLTQTYEYPGMAIWSCAWNRATLQVAFGVEGLAYCRHIETGDTKDIFTEKENLYSLCFSKDGNILFGGSHKGNLICSDLRDSIQDKVIYSMNVGRGLSYIHLLNGENGLIASGYDGKLAQIDLRNRQVVFDYPDHNNSHMKLPFSVDEGSGVLCSAGQDRMTRIWNLHDGKLLNVICPQSSDSFQPWVWYSESWKKPSGGRNSGLVMVSGVDLEVYKTC